MRDHGPAGRGPDWGSRNRPAAVTTTPAQKPGGDRPWGRVPRPGRERVGLEEAAQKYREKQLCYSWRGASPIEVLLTTNILLPRLPADYISARFCFVPTPPTRGSGSGILQVPRKRLPHLFCPIRRAESPAASAPARGSSPPAPPPSPPAPRPLRPEYASPSPGGNRSAGAVSALAPRSPRPAGCPSIP